LGLSHGRSCRSFHLQILPDSFPFLCVPEEQDVAQGHIDALNYAKARPEGGVSKFNLGTVNHAEFADRRRGYHFGPLILAAIPRLAIHVPAVGSLLCCYIKSPLNH
jgi:hypothetical protein